MNTSVWDAHIVQEESFFVEVTVRDKHPGLTREEALIGTRRINSAVNTVQLKCAKVPATIHDKGFERSIGRNGLDANSTAWRTSFETGVHVVEKSEQIISGELQAANRYHDLDHPAVAIDVPELECECNDSFANRFKANANHRRNRTPLLSPGSSRSHHSDQPRPLRHVAAGDFEEGIHLFIPVNLPKANSIHLSQIIIGKLATLPIIPVF
jgi:hypothetical protein